MRPRERRETGQGDLLRSRLDAIIDMDHALVKLARTIDGDFSGSGSDRFTRTSRAIRRYRLG